jgi:hypothetical protein
MTQNKLIEELIEESNNTAKKLETLEQTLHKAEWYDEDACIRNNELKHYEL